MDENDISANDKVMRIKAKISWKLCSTLARLVFMAVGFKRLGRTVYHLDLFLL